MESVESEIQELYSMVQHCKDLLAKWMRTSQITREEYLELRRTTRKALGTSSTQVAMRALRKLEQ